MKKLFVLAVVLCLAARFANPANAEVGKKFDRFTNQTIVSIVFDPESLNHGKPILRLLAAYDGEQFTGIIRAISLTFMSKSTDWKYLECSTTHLLIDGEPFDPGDAKHTGTVGEGYVLEHLHYKKVQFDSIKKMSTAKKIEAKICYTEFELSPEEMDDLKGFIRLLTPEK